MSYLMHNKKKGTNFPKKVEASWNDMEILLSRGTKFSKISAIVIADINMAG